jgi:recombination protein RecA
LKNNPQVAEAIEREIRANAGLIATKILDGAEEGDDDAGEAEIAASSEVVQERKGGRR